MRSSRLDRSSVDEKTAEVFDHYRKVRGIVPNLYRTIAHRPETLRSMVAHFRAVKTGTLSQRLKELLIIRTSQINHCEY